MQQLWPRIQALIQLQVNERTWNQFFRHLALYEHNAEEIVFQVPDAFFVTWFENHYLDYLSEVIRKATGLKRTIRLIARPANEAADAMLANVQMPPVPQPGAMPSSATQTSLAFNPGAAPSAATPAAPSHVPAAIPSMPSPPQPMVTMARQSHNDRVVQAGLNPRYTFDSFVVGSSNQFCNAACQAAAERPATVYNPLFLFGGVGLGKTHLLHAVGNELLRRNPSLRLTYVTSEQFMNELIHSLRTKDTNAFRTKYREQCDVLLMDDIQFIAGKDSTQEEFFHTFNALHQAHSQIVITSDKLPQELPGLEERLRSRFGWGLIADIQPPDIETRLAIIAKKAESENIVLDKDVGMFLATHIRSNVRELEGCLVRLKAFASLYQRPITLELAREQLKSVIREQNTHITVERILKSVADFYNVKVKDLTGPRRHRAVAHPRHVAMYLSRRHTSFSFPEIGRHFGGRDHSTVMNAVKKVEKLLGGTDGFKGELRSIEQALLG